MTNTDMTKLQQAAMAVIEKQLRLLERRGITPQIGTELEFYAFAPPGDQKRILSFLDRYSPEDEMRDGPQYRDDIPAEALKDPYEDKTIKELTARLKREIPEVAGIQVENGCFYFDLIKGCDAGFSSYVPLHGAAMMEVVFSHRNPDPSGSKIRGEQDFDPVDIRRIPEMVTRATQLLTKWAPEYGLHFEFSPRPIRDLLPYLDLETAKKHLTALDNGLSEIEKSVFARIREARTLDELPVEPERTVSGCGLQYNLSLIQDGTHNLFYDKNADKEAGEALWQAATSFMDLARTSVLPFALKSEAWERLHDDKIFGPSEISIDSNKAAGASLRYLHPGENERTNQPSNQFSRLELRLPGAEADPYVVLAAFLAGTTKGVLENQHASYNYAKQYSGAIDDDLETAKRLFAQSAEWKKALGPRLHRMILAKAEPPAPKHALLDGMDTSLMSISPRASVQPTKSPSKLQGFTRFTPNLGQSFDDMRTLAHNSISKSEDIISQFGLRPVLGATIGFFAIAPDKQEWSDARSLSETGRHWLHDMEWPRSQLKAVAPSFAGIESVPCELEAVGETIRSEPFSERFDLKDVQAYEMKFSGAASPIELCREIEIARQCLHRWGPKLGVHINFEAMPIKEVEPYIDLANMKQKLLEHGFPKCIETRIREARTLDELPIRFDRVLRGNRLNLELKLQQASGHDPQETHLQKEQIVSNLFRSAYGVREMVCASPLPFVQSTDAYQRLFSTNHDGPVFNAVNNKGHIGFVMQLDFDLSKGSDIYALNLNLGSADADPYLAVAAYLGCAAMGLGKSKDEILATAKQQVALLPPTYALARTAFIQPNNPWAELLGADFYHAVAACTEATEVQPGRLEYSFPTRTPKAPKPAPTVMGMGA